MWPFRHRVTSTRAYVYSIVIVWVTGVSGVWLLGIYHNGKLYASFTYSSALFFPCWLSVQVTYITIRSRLLRKAPDVESYWQLSTEKTLRRSGVFWLPGFVLFRTEKFYSCFPLLAVWFVNVLELANFIVNPFMYSLRVPIFQDAFQKHLKKRRKRICTKSWLEETTQNGEQFMNYGLVI